MTSGNCKTAGEVLSGGDWERMLAEFEGLGVDEHAVWCWQESRADFRQRLEAARVERLHRLEDSIFYLMEELDAAAGDEKATAKIQAIRVKLEVAKWVLSKMLPRYSDNPRNVSLAESIQNNRDKKRRGETKPYPWL